MTKIIGNTQIFIDCKIPKSSIKYSDSINALTDDKKEIPFTGWIDESDDISVDALNGLMQKIQ